MFARVRTPDTSFARSQVPDDGEELRIPASNDIAFMAFGESTIDMAKALATRISPKDLNWRYCAVGIPDSAPTDGVESISQFCCDKKAPWP